MNTYGTKEFTEALLLERYNFLIKNKDKLIGDRTIETYEERLNQVKKDLFDNLNYKKGKD